MCVYCLLMMYLLCVVGVYIMFSKPEAPPVSERTLLPEGQLLERRHEARKVKENNILWSCEEEMIHYHYYFYFFITNIGCLFIISKVMHYSYFSYSPKSPQPTNKRCLLLVRWCIILIFPILPNHHNDIPHPTDCYCDAMMVIICFVFIHTPSLLVTTHAHVSLPHVCCNHPYVLTPHTWGGKTPPFMQRS